jgi:putative ABC transport system ATP-binding protein
MIIYAEELTKTYQMGRTRVHALRGVSLSVREGEFIAVMVHALRTEAVDAT